MNLTTRILLAILALFLLQMAVVIGMTCRDSEFPCKGSNKVCVPLDKYCDGKSDCQDGSDEPKHCSGKSRKQNLII